VIYLLDSNILIFLIKNQPPAIAHRGMRPANSS